MKKNDKIDKKPQKRTTEGKKLFIEILTKNLGNISDASKKTGISRETYYGWMKSDKQFKKDVEIIKPMTSDFVKSALLQQIQKGNITAIIFYLKCQEGWTERQETQHSGKIEIDYKEELCHAKTPLEANRKAGSSP